MWQQKMKSPSTLDLETAINNFSDLVCVQHKLKNEAPEKTNQGAAAIREKKHRDSSYGIITDGTQAKF